MVFKNKKDERGIVVRNKARLVVQGYTQEEGIDYNEVCIPVARIKAIRLFFAYASFMGFIVYQMNVKSVFLYGTIEEEVYVCQPLFFEDPQFPDKVYKVEKALYGLHQALKAWYETLSTYLIENGFRRGTIDKNLFIKKDKGDILLVQVYVDDISFGSTKKFLCDEFEGLMHKRFQMSSMGELTFFLGLQVQQKKDGIFISQDKYVADILKKFDFATIKEPEGEGSAIPPKPQPTPSTSQPNVSKPQTESLQTETPPTVSHELQTEAHIEQILPSPSTYQRKQRKTKKHMRAKQVTALPHTSDRPKRQDTTLGGADAQTRPETAFKTSYDPPLSKVNTSRRGEDSMEYHDDLMDFVPPTPHDLPLSGGNTLGGDEGRIELIQELMETCTSLTKKVLALEEAKTAQDRVITILKLRVKRLEKKGKARTPQPIKRRLFKCRVETSNDKILGEDASKQERNDDKIEELNLTDGADTEVIVEDNGSGEKDGSTANQVSTARPEVSAASVPVNVSVATPSTPPTTTTIFGDEDLTIAQTLMKMRSEKAKEKEKGVVLIDKEEPPRLNRSTTTLQPLPTIDPKDKGKGVLVEEEPEKPVKLAELDRAQKERQKQEEATSAALAEEFDEIQARIDVDHELAVRLTHEEQEKYTIKEKAGLLAEFFERRRNN
ncbi:putative ribonuclease H-like domain-containing protein [Tanacetum coccineum]